MPARSISVRLTRACVCVFDYRVDCLFWLIVVDVVAAVVAPAVVQCSCCRTPLSPLFLLDMTMTQPCACSLTLPVARTDVTAVLFDSKGAFEESIYFANTASVSGAVRHLGDNRVRKVLLKGGGRDGEPRRDHLATFVLFRVSEQSLCCCFDAHVLLVCDACQTGWSRRWRRRNPSHLLAVHAAKCTELELFFSPPAPSCLPWGHAVCC